MDLNSLTQDQIADIKARLWSGSEYETVKASTGECIVAEGDSWFDYPPGLDILDNLKRGFKYNIKKYSRAGDTLENMVYGTEYNQNWNRKSPQIEETLQAVRRYKPRVFLFSGGGNDLAGQEFDAYFNHADSCMPELRTHYLDFIIKEVFRKAYLDLIARVLSVDSKIHIISHGYGYPVPDGRGVINVLDFHFVGPWLKPTFVKKNILKYADQREYMNLIIDTFNEMLSEIAKGNTHFHYLDLRSHIADSDWVNELHINNEAYNKVARLFHLEIQKHI
jgi:hypothetical protein